MSLWAALGQIVTHPTPMAVAVSLLAFFLLLVVGVLFCAVCIALFRADRKDLVDILEAAANWLPWRPRSRNRRR